MANRTFMEFFRSQETMRDNFLARLFSLFSEETIRIWCRDPSSPYEDLGRPTIRDVLSVEEAISRLAANRNPEYLALVEERRCWCDELFNFLASPATP